MNQQLIKIIEELRGVIAQQQMNISDDILFTQACSFVRGELASQSRNPFNQIKQEQSKTYYKPSEQTVMTPAQENFIKANEKKLIEKGFDIDNIQSKSDAFKIIKEFKKNG
jgi:hypothetical protein